MIKIKILREAGFEEAALGLSLSYNQKGADMHVIMKRLFAKDGGHNKFLESMVVWLDVTAARYWWQQFDTYRVGTTKQSGSTMHTIMKRPLRQKDFALPIHAQTLDRLNCLIELKDFDQLKIELPEGFLQRRVICTSYKTLRAVVNQRQHHKLKEWHHFCDVIKNETEHNEFFDDGTK